MTERGLYWLRRGILKEARPLRAKTPSAYLAQMLECIVKIERFTADGEELCMAEAMGHHAVLRNRSVIGEAVSSWTTGIVRGSRRFHAGRLLA